MKTIGTDTNPVSLVIGMLIALMGGLALGGWLFDSSLLAQVLPGIEYMAPNAALAFVLAGAWVALAASDPRRPALVVLGIAVSALAVMVLVQYLLGMRVPGGGLQILLNTRADSVAVGAFNGRMGLGAAFALLMSGVAMVGISTVRSKASVAAVMLCILCAGFIGLLGVSSDIIDFDAEFLQAGHKHLPSYSAFCLVVLSVALGGLSYRQVYPQQSPANEAGRTVFVAASILLFTTLFAGLLVFSITENQAEEELRRGLTRTLNDRLGVLLRNVAQASDEAEDIAGRRPLFRKRLLALAEGWDSETAQREIDEVIDSVMAGSEISALRLFNSRGELISARGAMVVHPVLSVPLKGTRQAVLLWDNRYVLRTQLTLTEQGRKVGSLIAEIPLLAATATLADFSGLGETGETLVCGPHMAGWMQCFPTRLSLNVAVRQREPNAVPLPMDFALAKKKGVAATLDYRKQRVIAAYAPVGELGLGLVLKKDEAEFYRPARERIGYILPVLGAMLVLGILLIRWRVAPLVRETVNARNQVKATLDNVAEGIITFDEKFRVISFNPAAGNIFGYLQEEVLGSDIRIVLPELDMAHLNTSELTGKRKDGSAFAMELTLSEVTLNGGRAYIAVVRDVTQRKLAHELLWQQAQIIEQGQDAIFSMDFNGRIISWNRGAEHLFGYSKEGIFGQTHALICPSRDCKLFPDGPLDELISNGGGALEIQLCRASGEIFHAYLSLSILQSDTGQKTGLICYAIDISARKRTELALRESEATLKSMATNVPGMVFQFALRAGGRLSFAYASGGAFAVCGLEPAVLMADVQLFLEMIDEADRDAFYAAMSTSVKQMAPWNWEGRLNVVNGTKWVNWRASPRQMPNGDVLWDGVTLNITDSKSAELEIEQSREQLRNLSAYLQTVREEEKAHIAREIHDELGGTLTALKMDTFWLAKKLSPGEPELRQKTDVMITLIDSAVQATRRITTELRPTILDDLGLLAAIEWQAGEFQNRMGIACEVRGDMSGMPDGEAAIALFRIFQEALTNVTRHAQATQVWVNLHTGPEGIRLTIQDNGCGISEARILNPTSHGIRGMFERARQLGGSVEVHGMPDEGTAISVRIPL